MRDTLLLVSVWLCLFCSLAKLAVVLSSCFHGHHMLETLKGSVVGQCISVAVATVLSHAPWDQPHGVLQL